MLTNRGAKTANVNEFITKGRFANKGKISLVQLKGGKARKGIYSIQHINACHGELKHFMDGFKGVSTKYLNNYLIWHNFGNYAKETVDEKENVFINFVLSTQSMDKFRTMFVRNPVPLIA